MKVCLLNDSFPPVIDGVANAVVNYAEELQKQKLAEVMVCTPEYPGTDYNAFPYRVVPYQSFDTTKIAKGYRAGNPFDLVELREMAAFKPDVIHTHCPVASTFIARMLRNVTDAPVIFTYHTKFDEDIANVTRSELLQKEMKRALVSNIEACDEVWVVSEGAGENLKSLGYQGNYIVMNNGVDFEKGRVSDGEVIEATKDYDLPAGVPVFLFVGRIIEYKGIPVILDAMDALGKAGIDYRMVFIGTGPDYDRYVKESKDRNLKCIFTGPVYDRNVLRAWNTRADLFLFLSTFDTNGLVVREAAACGLASVLVKGSCAAEGVTDGRNGYLIEKDSRELAELLNRIIKDLDSVHRVGMKAMDELYISWGDSVHKAYDRYAEILELKQRGMLESKVHRLNSQFEEMSEEISDELSRLIEKRRMNFESRIDSMENFRKKVYTEIKESIKNAQNDLHQKS